MTKINSIKETKEEIQKNTAGVKFLIIPANKELEIAFHNNNTLSIMQDSKVNIKRL